jgi:hypothetical protein
MSDKKNVDDLSLQELEALVEQRRRVERARQFAQSDGARRFRPVTVMPAEPAQAKKESNGAKKPRSLRDRALLVVEVLADVGLLGIIVGSLSNLQTLNQEVSQARAVTPNVTAGNGTTRGAGTQELPGSSFPPTNPLQELPGSSFAPEPAPPALGVQLRSVAALPVPAMVRRP